MNEVQTHDARWSHSVRNKSYMPSTINLNLHSHAWRRVANVKSPQMAVTGVLGQRVSCSVPANTARSIYIFT